MCTERQCNQEFYFLQCCACKFFVSLHGEHEYQPRFKGLRGKAAKKIACAIRHNRVETVASHCGCDFFHKILKR